MNLDKSDDLNQDTVAAKKKKMTVEQFFQQFNTLDMNNYGSWPLSVKITTWIFIFLAVGALGYFVVIKSQLESIANAQAKEQSLLNEFREKESKLRNLQQYQAQLQEMEANFNQQLEQLPRLRRHLGWVWTMQFLIGHKHFGVPGLVDALDDSWRNQLAVIAWCDS